MHRLEERIADWKTQLLRAESLSESDASELEQHLRDSIADLQKRGLTAEEAFLIADNRLGPRDALAAEYDKVHGSHVWRMRVFWMLGGYLLVMLAGTWINALSTIASVVAAYSGLSGTGMGIVAVAVSCTGWCLLLIVFLLLASLGGAWASCPVTPTRSLGLALGLAGAIAAGVALSAAGQVLAARVVPAETYGRSVMVTAMASYALRFLIPLVCLALMWALTARKNVALATA